MLMPRGRRRGTLGRTSRTAHAGYPTSCGRTVGGLVEPTATTPTRSPERAGRRPRHDEAARLLVGYLGAVAAALNTEGLSVTGIRMGCGVTLQARLALARTAPRPSGAPDRITRGITLWWAEDLGWSLSQTQLHDSRAGWHHLPGGLAPSPATVARFVTSALSHRVDPATGSPTPVGHHGQHLAPLIDALARYSPITTRVPASIEQGSGTVEMERSARQATREADRVRLCGASTTPPNGVIACNRPATEQHR
jgi:hypothetical protein